MTLLFSSIIHTLTRTFSLSAFFAGDVAYDLDSSKSQVGNDFMNAFQPAAASKAYMFSTGNHETYGTQGGNKFLQFAARFSSYAAGVGNSSGSGSQLWFSFNVGQIHFLFFCTENVAAPLSPEQMTAQLAFMTADLKAVNRDVTPWVVSVGHKFYSMDTLNWQPYEDVLNPGGVDLHLCGHCACRLRCCCSRNETISPISRDEAGNNTSPSPPPPSCQPHEHLPLAGHYYGRFFPITSATGTPGKLAVDRASVSADNNTYTDPKYMVGIVSGAPGDIEVNPPTCSVGPLDIHAANAQTCNYGWSKLQAINSTHLHYTFKSTKANDKPVNFTDNFYIVRSSPKKCEL